ncbi:hypothetical protein, partial [Vannielia litorea]|uniref:hypothetical protein n=1 Tax=Vannielia litorea TaxID=1217970 RepID=UPI001BCCF3E4
LSHAVRRGRLFQGLRPVIALTGARRRWGDEASKGRRAAPASRHVTAAAQAETFTGESGRVFAQHGRITQIPVGYVTF